MANVLILGGSEEAQLILRGLLRLHQHRIVGAGLPVAAALELLRQLPDPVLLVDAETKDPVWTDLVPEVHRAQPKARIILLTPSRSPRIDGQARSLGVDALVRRPFAIQELLTAVGSSSPPPASTTRPPSPPPPAEEGGAPI